ncbi:MAG TPA: DUF1802 family protein [Gemmataceae bacterium]|nr:DUF1802 family protein [Gemmataceae bacterium]
MNPLQQALKEWAVICRALAEGRQTLLLRKGGIAERGGAFEVEQPRFWLFPTYLHQQKDGIVSQAAPLLEEVEAERPPQSVVRLTHFAEAVASYQVHDLAPVEKLAHLHIWSPQTVRARFDYRQPGLFVVLVRVYRSPQTFDLPDTAAYAGCRSWVELEHALPVHGATLALEAEAFEEALRTVDHLLAGGLSEPRP